MKHLKRHLSLLLILALMAALVIPASAEGAVSVTKIAAEELSGTVTTYSGQTFQSHTAGSSTYYRWKASPAFKMDEKDFSLVLDLDFGAQPAADASVPYIYLVLDGALSTYPQVVNAKGNFLDSVFIEPGFGWNSSHTVKLTFLGSGKEKDTFVSVSNVTNDVGDWSNARDFGYFNSTLNYIDLRTSTALVGKDDASKTINITGYRVVSEALAISGLSEGYESGKDVTFTVELPDGMTDGVLLLDGRAVYNDSQGGAKADKHWLSVTIPGEKLTDGNHTVSFTANCADGRVKTAAKDFTVSGYREGKVSGGCSSNYFNPAKTTESYGTELFPNVTYDFNNWSEKGMTTTTGRAWTTTVAAAQTSGSGLTAVGEGVTDSAALFSGTSNTNFYMQRGSGAMISSGKLMIEFDYKCSSTATMQIGRSCIWTGSSGSWISAGKLQGTSEDISFIDTWKHVKLAYDVEGNTWQAWVGGKEVTLTSNAGKKDNNSDDLQRVQFVMKGGDHYFDNLRVYSLNPDSSITGVSYQAGVGDAVAVTNGLLPKTAEKLILTMSEGAEVTADKVTLKVNGGDTAVTSVSSDTEAKTVTITLPALKANDDLTLTVDGKTVSLSVSDAAFYIKSAGSCAQNGAVYANIKNYGTGEYTLIAAVYEGGRLAGLQTKAVSVTDSAAVTVMKVNAEAGQQVKIMVWNDMTNKLQPLTVSETVTAQ